MRSVALVLAFALAVVAVDVNCAFAGGGPEGVIVVVNTDSWASMAIANEYVRVRDIPRDNVVCLHDLKIERPYDDMDIEAFREQILKPVLKAIRDRGLEKQIDTIAYSADFPYMIDFGADIGKPRSDENTGSITSLTYLYQLVLDKTANANDGYLALNSNNYFRPVKMPGFPRRPRPTTTSAPAEAPASQPAIEVPDARAFDAQVGWDAQGNPVAADKGRRYLLSTMLGYTTGLGNSVDEATASLRRAASADGTAPKGTFYYIVNDNVRSTKRQWGFSSAIAKLKEMGYSAETANVDELPRNRPDIAGAMCGFAKITCEKCGSQTLPGAIVECLTSYGGQMSVGNKQTPITDYIRFGAAGSASSVSEPYAIQAKFPNPFLFVYYAAGCSLAESFYQSVQGPYQLLIIGDPLCRPWGKGPLATRDSTTRGGKSLVDLSCVTKNAGNLRLDEKVVLHVACDDAVGIAIRRLGEVVAKVDGSKGDVEIDAARLGLGTVTLYAHATLPGETGMTPLVEAPPLTLEIKTPAAMPALRMDASVTLADGPVITAKDNKPAVVKNLQTYSTLKDLTLEAGQPWELDGFFEVPDEGNAAKNGLMCQFQVIYKGEITLEVDGTKLPQPPGAEWRHYPVNLMPGTHSLHIMGKMNESKVIDILFGHRGTVSLGKVNFKHVVKK